MFLDVHTYGEIVVLLELCDSLQSFFLDEHSHSSAVG
jgi:hypothetical protein